MHAVPFWKCVTLGENGVFHCSNTNRNPHSFFAQRRHDRHRCVADVRRMPRSCPARTTMRSLRTIWRTARSIWVRRSVRWLAYVEPLFRKLGVIPGGRLRPHWQDSVWSRGHSPLESLRDPVSSPPPPAGLRTPAAHGSRPMTRVYVVY